MRPVRHIIANNLRYKYTSITQDENKFCVRVLSPVIGMFDITANSSEILSTDKLLNRVIEINSITYKVIAEGIFDKTSRIGKYWWTPGSNIMFYCTPQSISMGIVEYCQKGGLTIGTKEKSNEYGKRLGHCSLAQIFCRNSNDTIIETAKSITSDSEGFLFTNIDLSNADVVTPDQVNNNVDASKYLNIQYKLTGPKSVRPNQVFECKLEIFENNDGTPATDVDGVFYLETCDGYLPHTRVNVVKGVGVFKASSLLLEPGDLMRIKVGTKTFTGHSELLINII